MQQTDNNRTSHDQGAFVVDECFANVSQVFLEAALTRLPNKLSDEIYLTIRGAHLAAEQHRTPFSGVNREQHLTMAHAFFSILFFLGFKVRSVHSIKEKHLRSVFEFSKIHCKHGDVVEAMTGVMELFCDWIGKVGMAFFRMPGSSGQGKHANTFSMSSDWNPASILYMARTLDEAVAACAELCVTFGLTPKEAILLDPGWADFGRFLLVEAGTATGRPREIDIYSESQRKLLDRAKTLVTRTDGVLGARGLSPCRRLRRFYLVLRCSGVTFCELRRRCEGESGDTYAARARKSDGIRGE